MMMIRTIKINEEVNNNGNIEQIENEEQEEEEEEESIMSN